jgi:diguanylate cyclase (GGDEF)-like protein
MADPIVYFSAGAVVAAAATYWWTRRGALAASARTAAARHVADLAPDPASPDRDSLTSLMNRGAFEPAALMELARRRHSGDWSALLRIEIDGISGANETLGHAAGDELLRIAAARLRSALGENALIARLGGAGFVALMLEPARGDGERTAAAVVAAMAEPMRLDVGDAPGGATVGLSLAPADGEDLADLMRYAEFARLRAAQEGGGLWRRFEPGLDNAAAARRDILSALGVARAEQRLELYYQPIVEVATERLRGFEALMRWRHPTLGLVGASDFIGVAEETGLIGSLGQWALETACRDAARWPADLRVAVNVSPLQLRGGGLPDEVARALRESGLPASRLELEVTEGVLIGDRDFVRRQLEQLGDLGVSVSLDDFGSGFASFGYLCSLPFRKIKIDQSFVKDMTTRPSNAVVVKSIAGLASELGLMLVVEGVDQPEQRDWLIANGCAEAQGYLFGRPMPAAEVAGWIAARRQASAAAA